MTGRADLTQLLSTAERLGGGSDSEVGEALGFAAGFLGLPLGIVAGIDGDTYTVQHVHDPSGAITAGTEFDLGTTYCALTLVADDVVVVDQLRDQEHRGHPCYAQFELAAYIGAPVVVNGERFGTVSFSGGEPPARPWTDADLNLVRLMARLFGSALERRQLTSQLTGALRRMERTNAELRVFAGRAAHDLRSPLRGISSLAEFLDEDVGEMIGDEGRSMLHLIRERADQLAGLIGGLLDYSKVPFQPQVEELDLGELIDGTLALVDAPPGIQLDVELGVTHARLPQVPVETALLNLVDNAVKHHPGPTGRVVVSTAMDGSDLLLAVRDDGDGIAAGAAEKVFEPFTRLHTNTSGSGMGLSTVRRAAELHGATVDLESTVGEGSCFTLRWPVG